MSFQWGQRAVIAASVLLGLALASCGKDPVASTANGTVAPQGLGSDIKRCMDNQINQIIKTSTGDDVKAVNEGFASSMKTCAMNEQQKTQYLAYTNVLAGVMPDSVGDDALAELKAVISTQNYRRGNVEQLFTNGWAVVRWDGDAFTNTVKQVEVSPEVRSRAGIHRLAEVMTRDGRKAVAQEVFAIGMALVKFQGQVFGTMVRTADIAPRVDCLSGLCTLFDVIHNVSLRRGYVTGIYANSMATVRWNGDGFDSAVTLSEIAGRIPR